jgi:WhiB family redox-sensing transcriptional regulator
VTFDQPWAKQSACSTLTPAEAARIFFTEKPNANREARAICADCTVKPACLEYALTRPEWGIWGGTTLEERIALRRQAGIRLPRRWAAQAAR